MFLQGHFILSGKMCWQHKLYRFTAVLSNFTAIFTFLKMILFSFYDNILNLILKFQRAVTLHFLHHMMARAAMC